MSMNRNSPLSASSPSEGFLPSDFLRVPLEVVGAPLLDMLCSDLPRFRQEQLKLGMIIGFLASPLFAPTVAAMILLGIADEIVRWRRRKTYYEKENERRRIKRQMGGGRVIRRLCHASMLPPPSLEVLEAQYEKAKGRGRMEEKLRLGSMMLDIEAVVTSNLIRDEEGEIVGREPGIRGWLREHCPSLIKHYSSLIAYRRAAYALRKQCGWKEPMPVELLLTQPGSTQEETQVASRRNNSEEERPDGERQEVQRVWEVLMEQGKEMRTAIEVARGKATNLLHGGTDREKETCSTAEQMEKGNLLHGGNRASGGGKDWDRGRGWPLGTDELGTLFGELTGAARGRRCGRGLLCAARRTSRYSRCDAGRHPH